MGPQAQIERAMLPAILADILDVAGPEIVLAIIKEHGGQRVTLPVRPAGDNWLTRLCGPEVTAAIIERVGGGFAVDMPLATRWRTERRAAALDSLGVPVPQAARALGITERAVRSQRARRKARLSANMLSPAGSHL